MSSVVDCAKVLWPLFVSYFGVPDRFCLSFLLRWKLIHDVERAMESRYEDFSDNKRPRKQPFRRRWMRADLMHTVLSKNWKQLRPAVLWQNLATLASYAFGMFKTCSSDLIVEAFEAVCKSLALALQGEGTRMSNQSPAKQNWSSCKRQGVFPCNAFAIFYKSPVKKENIVDECWNTHSSEATKAEQTRIDVADRKPRD